MLKKLIAQAGIVAITLSLSISSLNFSKFEEVKAEDNMCNEENVLEEIKNEPFDETAGYLDLFDYETYKEFCIWLEEEKRLDPGNESDSTYINENINYLIFEAINEGVISNILNPNLRWAKQHPFISAYAMDLLAEANKTDVLNFYNAGVSYNGQSTNYYSILELGTVLPDSDENADYNKGHFYSYEYDVSDFASYYKSARVEFTAEIGDYSPSARTRFEQHYYNALYSWRAENKTGAMDELGRAIHYISDLGTPTHAVIWGRTHWNKHAQYEAWVDKVQSQKYDSSYNDPDNYDYWLASANDKLLFDSVNYTYFDFVRLFKFEDICNYMSAKAAAQKSYIDVDYVSGADIPDDSEIAKNYNIATINTLPMIQGIVAGILNKFYLDVNNLSHTTFAINNSAYYRLQNVKTQEYITAYETSLGLGLKTSVANGSGYQQFLFSYNTALQGFNISSYAYDNAYLLPYKENEIYLISQPNLSSKASVFLPVHVKNGYYRIMIGDSDTSGTHFSKVLDGSSGSLRVSTYDPDNMGQYWRFV